MYDGIYHKVSHLFTTTTTSDVGYIKWTTEKNTYILPQDNNVMCEASRGPWSNLQVKQQHSANHHHQAAEGRVEVDDAQQHAATRHRVQPVQPITVQLVFVERSATLHVHLEVGVGSLVLRQRLGFTTCVQRRGCRHGLVGWGSRAWQGGGRRKGGGGGRDGWLGGGDRCLTDGEKKENV